MSKITASNQKEIESCLEFMHRRFGIDIILAKCIVCEEIYGIKDGQGVYGISHGFCEKCGKIELKKIKK